MKSRLVARGFTQRHEIDYEETFAPGAKIATVRLLFVLAAHLDPEIEQMDIVTAFLCGNLQEKVVMKLPPGYPSTSKYCILLRTPYGLKQSPREWYTELTRVLENMSFEM